MLAVIGKFIYHMYWEAAQRRRHDHVVKRHGDGSDGDREDLNTDVA